MTNISKFEVAYITEINEYSKNNGPDKKYSFSISGYTYANEEVQKFSYEKAQDGSVVTYTTPFEKEEGFVSTPSFKKVAGRMPFEDIAEKFNHIVFDPLVRLQIVDEDFGANYHMSGCENVSKALSNLYSAETYKDKDILERAAIESTKEYQDENRLLASTLYTIKTTNKENVNELNFVEEKDEIDL